MHGHPRGLPVLVLTCLAALTACSTACVHAPPAPVGLCPQIAIPARPVPPSVVLPPLSPEGTYCLTQAQVDALANGIEDLQRFGATLEAGVKTYNAAYPPATAPR